MKKVLVVCGNGIASSSIMLAGLKDYLDEQHISADLEKASLMTCSDDFCNAINRYWRRRSIRENKKSHS